VIGKGTLCVQRVLSFRVCYSELQLLLLSRSGSNNRFYPIGQFIECLIECVLCGCLQMSSQTKMLRLKGKKF
jgi:hypothetical protein